MTVIEADGVETDPVDVDELVIYAGQRYSVVVEANQTVGNYCKVLCKSLLYYSNLDMKRDSC